VVTDPLTRRFERDAVLVGALLVGAGFVWGGLGFSGAVVGGASLAAYAYWGLRRGVDRALLGRNQGAGSRVKFFTRNAILAFVAYVMLARLRLHPIGVIVGATSIAVAGAAAAIRTIASSSRSRNSR